MQRVPAVVSLFVINIIIVFLLLKKSNIKAVFFTIGFLCLIVYRHNNFEFSYSYFWNFFLYDIIMLCLFVAVQVQAIKNNATNFQIAHSNYYNIFYCITLLIWGCQEYNGSYVFIFFFAPLFIISYLSARNINIYFKKMEKSEKSDLLYLTIGIWILYWWFQID